MKLDRKKISIENISENDNTFNTFNTFYMYIYIKNIFNQFYLNWKKILYNTNNYYG